jgi:fumarylacetoacetase
MTLLHSWSPIPRDSHFSLANIPFGIISTTTSSEPRVATVIGDNAFDLAAFAAHNGFSALSTVQPFQNIFSEPTLNAFAALGQPIHSVVRKYIQDIFLASTPYPTILKENKELQEICLIPLKDVRNHMPFRIGDYTDFYAGLNHASNCSKIFNRPMQPNYKHLPVAYHGRASSVVISGSTIRRPTGQILPGSGQLPVFSPCKKLDFELELGCFICKGNKMGEPIDVNEAETHLFGVVMMNDWSARDIQKWEMVPLGPLNSKNFGTTISPWVVLTEALQPFLTQGIPNDQQLLPYLQEKKKDNIVDIKLSVDITSESCILSAISKNSMLIQ